MWQLVGWRFPRCVASVREKARRGASSITTQPPSLSSVTRDGALEVQRAGRMVRLCFCLVLIKLLRPALQPV